MHIAWTMPSGLTWLFIAACAAGAWVAGYGLGYRRGVNDAINGDARKLEQFQQDFRHFLAGDVEQRSVCKNAVKAALGQLHRQKILMEKPRTANASAPWPRIAEIRRALRLRAPRIGSD